MVFPPPSAEFFGSAVQSVEVDPAVAFARQLRQFRVRNHLTQKEAARRLGMRSLYSYHMKDKNEVAAIIRQWLESSWIRSMHDWRRSIRATGLSMPQLTILMRLFHGGGCGVHEIGRHLDVTGAAASQFVDRLVNAGLAERSEDPSDRRVRRIALTPRGRTVVVRSMKDRFRWVGELAAVLSDAERKAVLKAIPSLIAAERRIAPQPGAGPSVPARST